MWLTFESLIKMANGKTSSDYSTEQLSDNLGCTQLFISPIGLSKMTELAPAKFAAFIMGIFFLSSFYGHFFAGKIAKFTSVDATVSNPLNDGFIGSAVESITGMTQDGAQLMGASFSQLYSYVSVYAGLGVVCILVGLGALVLSPLVKKLMGGVE